MDINFTCANCGQSLDVDKRLAGMMIRCPSCYDVFLAKTKWSGLIIRSEHVLCLGSAFLVWFIYGSFSWGMLVAIMLCFFVGVVLMNKYHPPHYRAPKITHICANCGSFGRPNVVGGGNLIAEIIGWIICLGVAWFGIALFGLIGIAAVLPAVLYSVRKSKGTVDKCPQCNAAAMIPVGTPRGQELWAQYNTGQPLP